MDSIGIAEAAAGAAGEHKAEGVVLLSIRSVSIIADYFVICTGLSTKHLQAVVDAVDERLDQLGVRFLRKEGKAETGWVLLDYGSVICHVFSREAREFYDLERLWGDVPIARVNGAVNKPAEGGLTFDHA